VLRDAALAELIFARVGRFELSVYETTNGAYARCVDAKACRPPPTRADLADPEKKFHPVVWVARGDAETFCRWIGGRLPSEAEWNEAARMEKAPGPAQRSSAPVASRPASSLGIYDLAGNVREWVAGGGQGIVRGGAWDQPGAGTRDTVPPGSRAPAIGFRCAR
ncbi:MAG: SUMF1/EgtB/PvdO family nonheme iron enzyme, partial [Acidobacteriota bacterium]